MFCWAPSRGPLAALSALTRQGFDIAGREGHAREADERFLLLFAYIFSSRASGARSTPTPAAANSAAPAAGGRPSGQLPLSTVYTHVLQPGPIAVTGP